MQPLTDSQVADLLVGCFKHEFPLSLLALTQTQALPYMQPARCLGWMFSMEEASVVCMVCYLSTFYFSLKQCFFLFLSALGGGLL